MTDHEKAAVFNRVESLLPFPVGSSGFFFYLSLLLFIGIFAVPNFSPFSETVFRVILVLIITVINYTLSKKISLLKTHGSLEINKTGFVLKNADGLIEQVILFKDVRNVYVVEGIPTSIFGLSDSYHTKIVEITLKDGKSLSFECETLGKSGEEITELEGWINAVKKQI